MLKELIRLFSPTEEIRLEKVLKQSVSFKDIQNDLKQYCQRTIDDSNINSESSETPEELNEVLSEAGKRKLYLLSENGFYDSSDYELLKSKEKELERQKRDREKKIRLEKEEIQKKRTALLFLERFRKVYPNLQILAESDFQDFIKKYDLFTSSPRNYIKDVPLFALEAIQAFRSQRNIFSSGAIEEYVDEFLQRGDRERGDRGRYVYSSHPFAALNLEEELLRLRSNISSRPSEMQIEGYKKRRDEIVSQMTYSFCLKSGIEFNKYPTVDSCDRPLEITAPRNYFKHESIKYLGKSFWEIEDPIISVKVADFRVIITAWGDEKDNLEEFLK